MNSGNQFEEDLRLKSAISLMCIIWPFCEFRQPIRGRFTAGISNITNVYYLTFLSIQATNLRKIYGWNQQYHLCVLFGLFVNSGNQFDEDLRWESAISLMCIIWPFCESRQAIRGRFTVGISNITNVYYLTFLFCEFKQPIRGRFTVGISNITNVYYLTFL